MRIELAGQKKSQEIKRDQTKKITNMKIYEENEKGKQTDKETESLE